MNMFNDDNEFKHPAFYDEKIEKEKKIWDSLFGIFFVIGLIAWVLFCAWLIFL